MKREILFRGKRVDNGEWVEGVALVWNGHAQIIKHHHMINSHWQTESFKVIPETVGQFTGLHDVKGSRIFEGDILDLQLNRKKLVEYFKDGFWLNASTEGATWNLRNVHHCSKVIGNIHDNPDLL